LYKGYSAALVSQVPYQIVLLSSFDYLERELMNTNKEVLFNKNDEYPFAIKFLQRFGAATLSLVAAQTLFYPLDTVKRCMQLSSSPGHKSNYDGSFLKNMNTLYKE